MYEPILKPKQKGRRPSVSQHYELICDGAVKRYHDGREVCRDTGKGQLEYRRRTLAMRDRQRSLCSLCGEFMFEDDTSFEHTEPRRMGGAFRDDRIFDAGGKQMNTAAHWWCNREKGSKR